MSIPESEYMECLRLAANYIALRKIGGDHPTMALIYSDWLGDRGENIMSVTMRYMSQPGYPNDRNSMYEVWYIPKSIRNKMGDSECTTLIQNMVEEFMLTYRQQQIDAIGV